MSSLADRLRAALLDGPKIVWDRRPEVLLSKQIPKPCHQLNPRTVLGSAWWDETRKAAYASTNHHCVACGSYHPSRLEGHELYEIDYTAGRMVYVETVPLCHLCHCYVHPGRLQSLLDKGEVSQEKFTRVMLHGDQAIRQAGLRRSEPYEGPFAEWGKWRLVCNGREYEPVFKTYESWLKKFK
jgi:hypothetical protein